MAVHTVAPRCSAHTHTVRTAVHSRHTNICTAPRRTLGTRFSLSHQQHLVLLPVSDPSRCAGRKRTCCAFLRNSHPAALVLSALAGLCVHSWKTDVDARSLVNLLKGRENRSPRCPEDEAERFVGFNVKRSVLRVVCAVNRRRGDQTVTHDLICCDCDISH